MEQSGKGKLGTSSFEVIEKKIRTNTGKIGSRHGSPEGSYLHTGLCLADEAGHLLSGEGSTLSTLTALGLLFHESPTCVSFQLTSFTHSFNMYLLDSY